MKYLFLREVVCVNTWCYIMCLHSCIKKYLDVTEDRTLIEYHKIGKAIRLTEKGIKDYFETRTTTVVVEA